MAMTDFPVGHPLAQRIWRRRLFSQALAATYFNKNGFMGEGTDAIIQKFDDTKKNPGDRVTYGLRAPLTGDGQVGDDILEGNEEALVFADDSLVINQLRHAVRTRGRMAEQRVPFKLRSEAMAALRDWWAERIDTIIFNQLAGNTTVLDERFNGMNATLAPDADHTVLADPAAANEAALTNTAASYFSLSMLDRAVARAKMQDPLIRPVRLGGQGDMYAAILSPNQVAQLRMSAGSQWQDIQKAAMQGGQVDNNPLLTGALGVYNGVALHESRRIPNGVAADGTPLPNVRRGVLLGAQAGVVAFGKDTEGDAEGFSWDEESFDYGNQLGVAVRGILGVKKTRFNGKDFGVMTLSSFSPAVK
jgi:N4-gp56 family major capsid protein